MTSFKPVGVLPPENATATFPMIKEIEGRMAPAIIAADVPTPNSILSVVERKLKNLKNDIYLGCLDSLAASF